MVYQLANNILTIIIDAAIYSEPVLLKCFYWYAGTFEVDIAMGTISSYSISLKLKDANDTFDWEHTIQKIKQDLIDFKLRQIVTDETTTIRELIIAKAFAHYEEEDTPLTEIGDPLGFDPKII
ncbi:His-Xaa-Ser system protein HxsD [Chitinophaga sancti]|uniref:His-Xaa-Ser system protein HxsD n=1 Tax=Chitinophaga sancti TaxID=1004 RepID=UPI002A74A006|nr:His-Xaa-Ser system protein HxsD [Chitinophaga sancti]WPQ63294.1 His-Xaa-Ser system protein HxsD [Chitinophaga sancti]